jgi:glycosidase
MLDFVPNHTGMDHEWVRTNPDYYIKAGEAELQREPKNYIRINTGQGEMILAHGRDPFFSGWPDTVQLNYGNPALQEAMTGELIKIAGQCDGVRCDMAMLVLPEVFEKTWGRKCRPFWSEAIRRVREVNPDFCFMAEVYWDMEWNMIQQGFDYAYDKRLYDRLKEGKSKAVREHFFGGIDYQGKMARFLENHDEPRVSAEFSTGKHEAAAILTYLSPGLRFFHQGQSHGRRKRISPHLVRAPYEANDSAIEAFYMKLLEILRQPVFRSGKWKLLECTQAWEGNRTHDKYIAFSWHGPGEEKIIVAVNYSPARSQCYIKLPFNYLDDKQWMLNDLLGDHSFEREGKDLFSKGLYLDEPGWKAYVFSLEIRNW